MKRGLVIPAVKSIMPNILGFKVPILLIGHPSIPPVAAFNRTKSRVKCHFCGALSGVGFGTK